jgi:hypothetical protein
MAQCGTAFPHSAGAPCGLQLSAASPSIDNNNEIINESGSALQARAIVVRNCLGCRRMPATQRMTNPARFPDASWVRLAHKKPISGKPETGAHFLSFYFPSTSTWRFVSTLKLTEHRQPMDARWREPDI